MSTTVVTLIDEFREQPASASRMLRELRAEGPDAFVDDALQSLLELPACSGSAFLARLILPHARTIERLADPNFLSLPGGIQLARRLRELDTGLEVRLLRQLIPNDRSSSCDPDQAIRVLGLVGEIVLDGSRIQALLPPLLRHPDERVRSKSMLLATRYIRNLSWLKQCMAEPNSRVRANAVEGLWGTGTPEIIEIFLTATCDPHHRVAGNGVVGLHRAGDLRSAIIVRGMSRRPDPMFRATAAWAMGATQDPRFLPLLAGMLAEEGCGSIRQNVLRATIRIRKQIAALREQHDPLRVTAKWLESKLRVRVCTADGVWLTGLPATAFVAIDTDGAGEIGGVVACPTPGLYELSLVQPASSEMRVSIYCPSGTGECTA